MVRLPQVSFVVSEDSKTRNIVTLSKSRHLALNRFKMIDDTILNFTFRKINIFKIYARDKTGKPLGEYFNLKIKRGINI